MVSDAPLTHDGKGLQDSRHGRGSEDLDLGEIFTFLFEFAGATLHIVILARGQYITGCKNDG